MRRRLALEVLVDLAALAIAGVFLEDYVRRQLEHDDHPAERLEPPAPGLGAVLERARQITREAVDG